MSSALAGHYFLVFFLVTIFMKHDECVSIIDQMNTSSLDFSQIIDKFSTVRNKSRLECPKGWQRFGGSCYYLSNMTSTFDTANKTCTDHYFNKSRLMQIRHPLELYYAAHVLVKNDFLALLVQIDTHLFEGESFAEKVSSNDFVGWRSDESSFRRARLKYFNRKTDQTHRKENTYSDDGKKIDFQSASTTDRSEAENIDLSIDDIRHVCDNFSRNGIKKDTDVFLLTRYEIAGKFICSIVDTESETNYEHLCQYSKYFSSSTSEREMFYLIEYRT